MADSSNPDGWTFASIYKHIEMMSGAQKEAVKAAIDAAQKAVDKAESAQQLRNEAQNEWRAAMKDQQATFADKEQTNRRITTLEQNMAARSGAASGFSLMGSVVLGACTVAMVAIAVLTIVLTRH